MRSPRTLRPEFSGIRTPGLQQQGDARQLYSLITARIWR